MIWNSKPITLQIDHISGRNVPDCDGEWNLRRVCGNCHSQRYNHRNNQNKNSKHTARSRRERMLKNGIEYKCKYCDCKNMQSEHGEWLWQDWPLHLEVDHIDGNHKNEQLSNLCFTCNTCHTQTSTYCGRNSSNRGQKRKTHRTREEISTVS